MKYPGQRNILSAVLCLPIAAASLFAEEILPNRDFALMSGKAPTGWEFRCDGKNTSCSIESDNDGAKFAKIVSERKDVNGLLIYRTDYKFPKGSLLSLSGEYKTADIELGQGGKVFVSTMHRSVKGNDKQPVFWLNAELEPTDEWKTFSVSKRVSYDIETVSLHACIWQAKGTVCYRNLSLQVTPPSHEFSQDCEVIWREIEDIYPFTSPTNWGYDIEPDYFSGRGGIALDDKRIDWNFQIAEVTDPVTLFSKERTWHLWLRIYGYMESPRIFIEYNGKHLNHIDTPANEKVSQGKYAGPGKYVWVYGGNFTTKGGAQMLSIVAKGRLCADCLFLTDDAQYAPVKFEAKDFPQAKALDVRNKHIIKCEYEHEGMTDRIPLPLSFRIAGERMSIPNDKEPGIFHFSLTDDIIVDGMSSHWAGTDWNSKSKWGEKFLTYKKTGERVVNGRKFNDYEAYLYFLSGNQYLVFGHIAPESFKAGAKSLCEYWLEHDGEKQRPEIMEITHTAIEPVRPFKKIFVGPSYVPLKMMYYSYPDCFNSLNACGFNYMGSWYGPAADDDPDRFSKFRDEAYAKGFLIAAVVTQYTGIEKEHIAVGIDGKPYGSASGQGTHGVVSLALDKDDEPIAGTLHRTREAAKYGISLEYDDEMTNMLEDKVDYAPKTKALFREYLAKKNIEYMAPEEIVRNKAANPSLYNEWVDFKCSRIGYWYSLYRQAFEEGLVEAEGKYPADRKPMLLTCVQGAGKDFQKPEDIKIKGFLDYKLLSKYCDLIQIMSYTYSGVDECVKPGDALEMYAKYLGRDVTVPILLAGGYGTETRLDRKVMLKYQMFESLMQKPKMIVFYAGATIFNAPTLAPVVEAIRIAQPYEEFFTDGVRFYDFEKNAPFLRLKALSLGKRVLLYAANYTDNIAKQVTVTFPQTILSAIECDGGKKLSTSGKEITFDFQKDRGQLFLLEFPSPVNESIQ